MSKCKNSILLQGQTVRQYIDRINSKGPKMDPWGTEQTRYVVVDSSDKYMTLKLLPAR